MMCPSKDSREGLHGLGGTETWLRDVGKMAIDKDGRTHSGLKQEQQWERQRDRNAWVWPGSSWVGAPWLVSGKKWTDIRF